MADISKIKLPNNEVYDLKDNSKASKVSNATSGNFAALDSNGDLVDSNHKHSDYITPTTYATTTTSGVIKVGNGLGINDGSLYIYKASDASVKGGTVTTDPIVPATQDQSVYYGLSKLAGVDLASGSHTVGIYPAASKTAICDMLGVTNVIKQQTPQDITISSNWATAALSPRVDEQLLADQFAFLNTDQIIIEQTVDGGETWTDAGYTGQQKQLLFSHCSNSTITIPLINGKRSLLAGLRVTITAQTYTGQENATETERYNYWNTTYYSTYTRSCYIQDYGFRMRTMNDTISVKIEHAKIGSESTWTTCWDSTTENTYLSSYNYGIAHIYSGNRILFGAAKTSTSSVANIRFTFMTTGTVDNPETLTSSSTGVAQTVAAIYGYGDGGMRWANEYSKTGHLYTIDVSQNATFPAKVIASSFQGTGTDLTALKAGNISSGTLNAARLATSGVTAGTYGSASAIPVITVDNKGRVTSASNQAIGGTQTVSGTNVTINGVANTSYLCGAVQTISITPPTTGIVDVIFSSGSTAALLTLPSTVKMPAWFDSTSLETNTTYEINILNGVYGVVMYWDN